MGDGGTPPDPLGPPPLAERLHRWIVRLHQREFRERYGEEMQELFRDQWRAAEASGGAGASFWLGTLGAALGAAVRERLAGGMTMKTTGGGGMEGWTRDLRYAVRSLLHRPGFTLVVVATLALGMGANVGVFGVIHSVLLAPLPYDSPEQLVRLYGAPVEEPGHRGSLSGTQFVDYRERLRTMEVAAFYDYEDEGADLSDGDQPERVRILRVGSHYFDVLRAPLLLGRGFLEEEEIGGSGVVVVSEDVWRRYLAGDRSAVGRTLLVDGVARRVVGVAPAGFRDPEEGRIDIWLPQDLVSDRNNWDNHYLSAYARLAPGVPLEQARAELQRVSENQWTLDPQAEGWGANVLPLRQDLVGSADRMLAILMGAVSFLLLIACVNVASLFLARASSRRREMAIRTALGSGRLRLLRQLLLESLVVALAGAAAGVALAWGSTRALAAAAPPGLPRATELGVSAPVLLYGFGLALLAGLLFGGVPALRLLGPGLEAGVRDESRGGTDTLQRSLLRRGLVVAEVALAIVLLVGAGLMVRSSVRLAAVELGLDPDDVLAFQVNLPEGRYPAPEDHVRFRTRLDERLAAIPGVETASATSVAPVSGSYFGWGTRRVDEAGTAVGDFRSTHQRVVTRDYFDALDLRLLRGRLFGPGDDEVHRVVISESTAELLFPGEEALGHTLRIGPFFPEVIGVVADEAVTPRGETEPLVYHDLRFMGRDRAWTITQLVEARGDPAALVPAVRATVAELDPALVVHRPQVLEARIATGVARERFVTLLLGAFAVVALLLAAVGVYGILASAVSTRRREIGIRMALGAEAGRLRRMVVGQGMGLVLVGMLLGLAGAAGVTGWLRSLLYEVDARDPAVFAAVPLLLAATALLAAWIPAHRATRVDPTESFREE